MSDVVPEWQYPPGVTRGLVDYTRADHIADEYDEFFAYNSLFEYDQALLLQRFSRPGVVVDLGCGTGRLLIPFAQRGFTAVGVDLSIPMLRAVGRKASAAGVEVGRLHLNMTELGAIRDGAADYCMIMFSSLGMVQGHVNRQAVLVEARRILRPGGCFAIHVHNRWFNLFDPEGRWWVLRNLLVDPWRTGLEVGDKYFDYRRIPNMFLHVFSLGELKRMLRRAGFEIEDVIPLNVTRQRPLARPWFLGRIRANGWVVFCR
jgi:SAM-dependent methyltransferase